MSRVRARKQFEEPARLRAALRAFLQASDRLTAAAGLTTQRYELLLIPLTAPGGRVTVSQIAAGLGLAPSSASELVQRSEELGLVRRELDPANRRAVYVAATPEGERRAAKTAAALRSERQRLGAVLSEIDA